MERTWREKIEGTTDQILAQIRKLIDEGNVRRVVVKHQGKTVAEFPLTVGVVGTVIAPVAAAIGALTAVLAECTHRSGEGGAAACARRGPHRGRARRQGRLTGSCLSGYREPATFDGFGRRRRGAWTTTADPVFPTSAGVRPK